ncbi:hypothetical protein EVAR_3292_1 [Eumeta japonica]|uniref:Uncharacterized protein n=1 Tax=Eumeta variegata TaxID=151549 RepID=A0A4C1SVX6_EUMVA|nr:hypothetical protein EVAR_3292_1 [Eumeta japonica]
MKLVMKASQWRKIGTRRREERRVGERNTCAVHHSQSIQSGKVSQHSLSGVTSLRTILHPFTNSAGILTLHTRDYLLKVQSPLPLTITTNLINGSDRLARFGPNVSPTIAGTEAVDWEGPTRSEICKQILKQQTTRSQRTSLARDARRATDEVRLRHAHARPLLDAVACNNGLANCKLEALLGFLIGLTQYVITNFPPQTQQPENLEYVWAKNEALII